MASNSREHKVKTFTTVKLLLL